MKGFAAAFAILLAAACTGDSPPTGRSSDTHVPSSARPHADAMTCKLPVYTATMGGESALFLGGFVTFPDATQQSDPAGVIRPRYPDDFATTTAPVLYGSGPASYDLAQKRWLPVPAAQSSPDGAYYAYGVLHASNPRPPVTIHVVDVAHATEKIFPVTNQELGSTMGARVTDFDGSNVYFTSVQQQGPPLGAWRLNVATGSVAQLSHLSGVGLVRAGYAWINRLDPRDPLPPPWRFGSPSNSVVRVDLSNGSETVWYYAPGQIASIVGLLDSGSPIIRTASGPDFDVGHGAVRLVPIPGATGTLVFGGGMWLSDPQVDGSRIWFGGSRAMYLYTPAEGLRKVFDFNGEATVAAIVPAGFCR